MKSLQPKATHDAGVWKLPKGQEYYRDSLIHASNRSSSSPRPSRDTGP